ncbi:MAG: DNA-processing protein DprA [Shimia sp.]
MIEGPHTSSHPPLPPTAEVDRFARLRLLRSRRVGIVTFHRLVAEHGSAAAALEALPEVARAAGVERYEACPPKVAQAEMRAGRKFGARLVALGEPGYPPALCDLEDAPPLLWMKGDGALPGREAIALVGARNASSLGVRMARHLAERLGAEGHVVASGLARGIDAAAHEAALPTGTIAVVAGGLDKPYPPENADLMARIGAEGLLISEQPFGLQPQARHFPARNRLVSGLARAVVVVEAAAKSGTLITARNALDQGREVLAVPGHPFDGRAAGCNALIRDGATLVRSAADVIETLGPREAAPELPLAPPPKPPPPRRPLRETARLHAEILGRLGPSPVAEDQLARDLGTSTAEVVPALIDLEMEGAIERRAGGLLTRSVQGA